MNLLYAWEWGAGVSHFKKLAPLVDDFLAQGCGLTIAARDLTHARAFFPQDACVLCQAPVHVAPIGRRFADPRSLASIAQNLGYDRPERVSAWMEVWASLMRESNADLVICDFGVLAPITAHALGIPTIALGVGFECPPPCAPLAVFGDNLSQNEAQERAAEEQLLDALNQARTRLGFTPLRAVAEGLVSEENTLLCTIPEFDPYSHARKQADYLGWSDVQSYPPAQWPQLAHRKAVAYLKPFAALPQLVRCLGAAGIEVALVPDGVSANVLQQIDAPTVRVQISLVDFARAAAESDFAVTNANHGSTMMALAQGRPVLVCPTFIEQRITAARIAQLGLGVSVDVRRPDTFAAAINEIVANPRYRESAVRFQQRYSSLLKQSLRKAKAGFVSLIQQATST